MGKASSNKKVARAASTGGGRTARGRKPWLWYGTLTVFVALGVFLITSSRADYIDGKTASTPPSLKDHWHVAYGIYICDEFVPALGDKNNDRLGVHSHEDGLIHIHPKSKRAAGKNAKLDRFLEEVDATVEIDSIEVPGRKKVENGDKCGKQEGEVVVKTWDNQADTEGKLVKGDPGDLRFKENQIITIAFVPEGTELEQPPSVANLANPVDMQSQQPVPPGGEAPPGQAPPEGTPPADGSTPPPSPPEPAATPSSAPPDNAPPQ